MKKNSYNESTDYLLKSIARLVYPIILKSCSERTGNTISAEAKTEQKDGKEEK